MATTKTTIKKHVFITGGASGLGQAMAYRWALEKAKICIADINEERGLETLKRIKELGGEGFYVHCNIASDGDVANAKAFCDEHLGHIDIVVNCAGVATLGSLLDESLATWQWVLDINVLGMVRVSKLFIPDMVKRKQGYFVNVASQAGITPAPLMGSYNVSKASVVAYSETMNAELAQFNIGVSVLCPAFVRTNLNESLNSEQKHKHATVEKLLNSTSITPEDIANATLNAISRKQFMIATHKDGRGLYLIKRWLPSLYFRFLKKRSVGFIAKAYKNVS